MRQVFQPARTAASFPWAYHVPGPLLTCKGLLLQSSPLPIKRPNTRPSGKTWRSQEPAFVLSHPYFPIVIFRRDEKYTGKLMKLKVFSISGTPTTRSGHRLRKVYRGRWQIKLIADWGLRIICGLFYFLVALFNRLLRIFFFLLVARSMGIS